MSSSSPRPGALAALLAGCALAACGGAVRGQALVAPAPASIAAAPDPEPELATVDAAVAAGRHWRLETPQGPVHVWIPAGYVRATAATIVYVHGYFTDVDAAWRDHQLPQQFARSGLNAVFIAPEAPSSYELPVAWDSLGGLLNAVEVGIQRRLPRAHVTAVGHSAAFRTLTSWLTDPQLDTLVLFDAAYEVDQFVAWIKGSRSRRLIDVGDDTRPWTEQLHRALPDTVMIDGFPAEADGDLPAEARDARILYIKSSVGHMPLVTGGVALPIVLRALSFERVAGAPTATR